MAKALTDDQETIRRRSDALERIQRLRERVSGRNGGLPLDQAEDVAETLSHDAVQRLKERGEISFQRDKS